MLGPGAGDGRGAPFRRIEEKIEGCAEAKCERILTLPVSNKDPEADELTWLRGFWNAVHVSFDDDDVTAIDD